MKLSLLRKYYPFLHQTQKNIHWRPITDAEIQASTKDFQVLANCYEESVRHVLALTPKGEEMLKKRIKISTDSQKEPAYKIKYNVNGKEEIYRADKADYYGKFWKIYNC